METKVLNGKVVAKALEENIKKRADNFYDNYGYRPLLATIIVGHNPASEMYVKMKMNACKRVGLESIKIEIDENAKTEDVLEVINKLNNDDKVTGILLQHPIAKHMDEGLCFDTIALEKDVDGVNTASFGKMTMKGEAFLSATPAAIMEIIDFYNIDIEGKHAVVVGRSPILGKPVSMLLLNKNATVTICHSKTKDLDEYLKTADIVVAAVGKPNFIKGDSLKDGVVIIDAGYNKGNIGDVDINTCLDKVSAYTPVPGGVGPVTIAKLLDQTMTAAENKKGKKLIKK